MRSVRNDTDTDDELAVHDRAGEHHALTGVDARHQLVIERIEIGAGLQKPKGYDRKLRLGHDFDAVDLVQFGSGPRGEIELLLELRAERLDAEEFQRQP